MAYVKDVLSAHIWNLNSKKIALISVKINQNWGDLFLGEFIFNKMNAIESIYLCNEFFIFGRLEHPALSDNDYDKAELQLFRSRTLCLVGKQFAKRHVCLQSLLAQLKTYKHQNMPKL